MKKGLVKQKTSQLKKLKYREIKVENYRKRHGTHEKIYQLCNQGPSRRRYRIQPILKEIIARFYKIGKRYRHRFKNLYKPQIQYIDRTQTYYSKTVNKTTIVPLPTHNESHTSHINRKMKVEPKRKQDIFDVFKKQLSP